MGTFRDMTGYTTGFLTVLEQVEDKVDKNGRHRKMWRCSCSNCGGETIISSDALTGGQQVSCGCYQRQRAHEARLTHGLTDTRLYYVWSGIKNRCYCVTAPEYKLYGARGIKMCDSWHYNFGSFREWALLNGYDEMAPRGHCTVDRIDVNGDYEPNNCRIITQREQMQNTRKNHFVIYNGETLTIAEWSRRTGIKQEKIRNRIVKLGWTPERALTSK